MAPVHWSDLANDDEDGAPAPRPGPAPAFGARAGEALRGTGRDRAIGRAMQDNPAFANLVRQREALERRMERAMAGGQQPLDPRDAARFAVQGLAQRRAEHEAWQRRRDEQRARQTGQRETEPETGAAVEPALRRFGRALGPAGGIAAPRIPGMALRPTPGEQPGGSPLDPARWMSRHDANRPRQAGGGDDYARLDRRLDRARSQLDRVQDPMADLDRQFEEADRKLAAEGLDAEREDLAQMKKDMRLDDFNRPSQSANDTFDKFRSTTDRTKDAGERIEQDWLDRRDAIGGEDMESYMRPLRELKDRVLGMKADDFDRRSDERRAAALERQRQRRREERADEERRERALRNRRERERENAD